MNFDKPFWKTVLRESDGTASASRLLSAAIVAAAISWVSFLVVKTHQLPALEPVGIFVTTTTSALYGVNKITAAVTSVLGK